MLLKGSTMTAVLGSILALSGLLHIRQSTKRPSSRPWRRVGTYLSLKRKICSRLQLFLLSSLLPSLSLGILSPLLPLSCLD